MSAGIAQISTRPARLYDVAALTEIYAEGIEDRSGTFETSTPTESLVQTWFGEFPLLVAEDRVGKVCAFAGSYAYRSRPAFGGVAEFRIYVRRDRRGHGFGSAVTRELCNAAEKQGMWKLLSRAFVENTAARRMLKSCGFREVGIYKNHAQLDGHWRDVVIVERVFEANLS